MNILIVEDEQPIAEMVGSLLEDDGHKISMVGSGSAALSAALLSEYDLLICDLMLPDLQGTEIVRALKAQSPRLPVMVISALDAADWAKPCEDAGATRFLQKPLDLEDLRQEVALVNKARLNLHLAIVDTDPIHATRVTKQLSALGCDVATYPSAEAAQAGIEGGHPVGLIVVESAVPQSEQLITWGKNRGIAAFAYSDVVDQKAEDKLMRAGAAFIMGKPLDIDALLTQAAFMVAM